MSQLLTQLPPDAFLVVGFFLVLEGQHQIMGVGSETWLQAPWGSHGGLVSAVGL